VTPLPDPHAGRTNGRRPTFTGVSDDRLFVSDAPKMQDLGRAARTVQTQRCDLMCLPSPQKSLDVS
jgi:hypothetical protein